MLLVKTDNWTKYRWTSVLGYFKSKRRTDRDPSHQSYRGMPSSIGAEDGLWTRRLRPWLFFVSSKEWRFHLHNQSSEWWDTWARALRNRISSQWFGQIDCIKFINCGATDRRVLRLIRARNRWNTKWNNYFWPGQSRRNYIWHSHWKSSTWLPA